MYQIYGYLLSLCLIITKNGIITIHFLSTIVIIVNSLTKPLPLVKFKHFLSQLELASTFTYISFENIDNISLEGYSSFLIINCSKKMY